MKTITNKNGIETKIFAKTIEDTALQQIEQLANSDAYINNKIRIMPDCLPDYSEILTDKGYKKISELTLNDKIANYDSKDGCIFFDFPKNIIKRQKRIDEKIYEFYTKVKNISITASENHRMAVIGNMDLKAKECNNLIIKDFIFNGHGLKNNINNLYSDNDIRIISWIVGDGSFKITHNNRSDNYRIRFGLKKERKINRLLQLLNEENIQYSIITDNKQTTITINTKCSKKYLDYLNYRKHFPVNFILINREQAKKLLGELIQIDGDYEAYKNKRGYRLNSKSKEDLDIIQAIITINFGKSIIKKIEVSNSFIDKSIIYYLNYVNDEIIKKDKSGYGNNKIIKKEKLYNGFLICIECTSTFFICRQNGLSFITGNCHAGNGCTIGTTIKLTDRVVPNTVGVDINCGMLCISLGKSIDYVNMQDFDRIVNEVVPCGFNIHEKPLMEARYLNNLNCKDVVDMDIANRSIGTLGGGNHFIEIDIDDKGNKYLVIHSGSRNLGVRVCKYYQDMAISMLSDNGNEIKEFISRYKKEGRQSEISEALKTIPKNNIDKELAYLSGESMDSYIHDMNIILTYANQNRYYIAGNILNRLGKRRYYNYGMFTTLHNYIDTSKMILRKGAVRAMDGEKLIIPMNMRDGSLICIGKGNPDWNYSAPHGAGRMMSRNKAKETLSMNDFNEQMKGIASSSVCESTIDESPMAYKPMDEILECIKDTVKVYKIIKPIYNFKAK